MSTGPYYFRRESCPQCGGGPLIFISCHSCGAVLAWCGEEDHAVGVYDGKDVRALGSGETRDWARKGCPVCKNSEMGYSTGDEVKALGFVSADVMGFDADGSTYVANPEL